MKHTLINILIILTFLFVSCQKEDYNLPTDVILGFDQSNGRALGNNLDFSFSQLRVENFRFVGKRNVGSDIDFFMKPTPEAKVNFFADVKPDININIPKPALT